MLKKRRPDTRNKSESMSGSGILDWCEYRGYRPSDVDNWQARMVTRTGVLGCCLNRCVPKSFWSLCVLSPQRVAQGECAYAAMTIDEAPDCAIF